MGQNISFRGMKRHQANSNKANRKSVYIPGDTWLEALKFLTCPQWSQNRYVCRQINRIVERNISHLQKFVLDCADMYYHTEYRAHEWEKPQLNKNTVVAFDTVIQKKQSTQWFVKRGFPLNAPVDIPADNMLIAAETWTRAYEMNVNIRIHGSAQERIPYSEEEKRFPSRRKPVLFSAQFSPLSNRYSWHYLAQFLKFIYDPTSCVKEVEMFAVNQKFIDSLKFNIGSMDNEPRYIRCESFTLKGLQPLNVTYDYIFFKKHVELQTVHFPDLLKWLTRNVRAETLTISLTCDRFDSLANFLLDPSGANECASSKVKIDVSDPVHFLSDLIEKFRASPLVEDAVPTIEFLYPYRHDLLERVGASLIEQEVLSLDANALYTVSNGKNRMRISLCKTRWPGRHDCEIKIDSI